GRRGRSAGASQPLHGALVDRGHVRQLRAPVPRRRGRRRNAAGGLHGRARRRDGIGRWAGVRV
ncbi:MAG: hypothetical protein AVDCRST_MAG53-706, partial [uncultured Solirubrobacteraceae bacterium]